MCMCWVGEIRKGHVSELGIKKQITEDVDLTVYTTLLANAIAGISFLLRKEDDRWLLQSGSCGRMEGKTLKLTAALKESNCFFFAILLGPLAGFIMVVFLCVFFGLFFFLLHSVIQEIRTL